MRVNPKYFRGLNELRCLAAIAVVIHHIELFKHRDGLGFNLFEDYEFFISGLGKNAVYFFFVLSGFLITYLLFVELESTGRIVLRKFYLRRIFRIWPLYYFIMLLSFVLMPFLVESFINENSDMHYLTLMRDDSNYSLSSIILYFSFLPNFALKMNYLVPGATQAWSIGVEEQFYLVWPLIMFVVPKKKVHFLFLLFTLSPILILLVKTLDFSPLIVFFLKTVPFEYLAMGAFGAYLYVYHKSLIDRFSKSRLVFSICILSILCLLLFDFGFLILQKYALGGGYLLLILCTSNDGNPYAFRNKTFSYLGEISYGIYMYHPIVMFLCFLFVNWINVSNTIIYNILLYTFIFGFTIVCSYLSYEYFEKRFITMKNSRFKVI